MGNSCKIIFGKFEPGPWHLGKFSVFVNAWACLWTLFVSIIFILPTVRPVTAINVSIFLNQITTLLTRIDELRFSVPGLDTRCSCNLLVY